MKLKLLTLLFVFFVQNAFSTDEPITAYFVSNDGEKDILQVIKFLATERVITEEKS